MDDNTLLLVLELQLEDILALQKIWENNEKQKYVGDSEIAFQLQEQDLRVSITSIKDRIMCQSISRAIQDDGALLALVRGQERQATRDRNQALAMGGLAANRGGTTVEQANTKSATYENLIGRLAHLNDYKSDDMRSLVCNQDSNVSQTTTSLVRYECIACSEAHPVNDIYKAPCPDKHAYCKVCLTKMFKNAMTDETLFPPHCCRTPLTLSSARAVLGSDIMQRVERKAIEVQSVDRTYCSDPNCAQFILPDSITGTLAVCNECPQRTCTLCKQEYHHGDCGQALDAPVLRAAQQAGWRRCYQCHAVVELTFGCNHIRCRCRAEFCYCCGKQWKTCDCPKWDESRLLSRSTREVI